MDKNTKETSLEDVASAIQGMPYEAKLRSKDEGEPRKLNGIERDILIQRQTKVMKEQEARKSFEHRMTFKRAQAANPIKPRKRKRRTKRKQRR